MNPILVVMAPQFEEIELTAPVDILRRCDQVTLLQEPYTPDCFQRRNQYLVEHSSLVIAVWNGRPSGTGNTVSYARACGKWVRVLHP